MLGLVVGCATSGGAAETGATPSPAAPSAPPSSSRMPPATPVAGPVDTAEEAVAAVVAEHPEFVSHRLLAPPGLGGEPLIGLSKWVVVTVLDDGFQTTFVSGSGDCQSGCIEHHLDVFHVDASGVVRHECSTDPSSTGIQPGVGLPVDPCAQSEA